MERKHQLLLEIKMKIQLLLILTFFMLLITACASQSTAQGLTVVAPEATYTTAPTTAPNPIAEVPTQVTLVALPDTLGNLSYAGLFPDQQITLTDGTAYYEDGGSGRPFVRLIDHLIATGDLNGDGVEDAVALLVDYSTGSGDFVYLAPVLNAGNEPTPLDALMIGDRTPVKSLTIDGGQVIVEFIGPGPSDPLCCPTWNVRKVFTLEDGRLVEQSSDELSKVSLDDLSGTSWRLLDLNSDQEPLRPETEITLRFDDRQISGSAGCNDYNTTVTGDDLPQTFVVSQIATTARSCSEPISNQETHYLSRLAKVVAWRYDFGYLALTYKLGEGDFGQLLFAAEEEHMTNTNPIKPNSVTDLEASYGAPSQAGFGSAVFYEKQVASDDLEKMALEKYRYFVGDLWERYGEDAWMGPWKQVHARKPGAKPDIVAELRGIQDPQAAISVPMILDNIDNADSARTALSAAYDDPAITDLRVYNLGDSGAMSGLLIAGRNNETGEVIFLVFLLD